TVQDAEISNNYNKKNDKYSHYLFDEIDELIHAKIALSKDFKVKGKVDDEMIRQLQVIFEKMKYDKNDDNFAMQYYIPLLVEIEQKNMFEQYMLYLFSDYNIEKIDKHNEGKKGKERLKEVSNIINHYNKYISGTREINFTKRTIDKVKYLVDGNHVIVGKPKDTEFKELVGPIKIYKNHLLIAEGQYKNGEK